jgi:hypothetical protein
MKGGEYMKTITKAQWINKKRMGYAHIKDGQKYILTNDNGATVLLPVIVEEILDQPEYGKQYNLTGSGKSIMNGNSWAESEVKEV